MLKEEKLELVSKIHTEIDEARRHVADLISKEAGNGGWLNAALHRLSGASSALHQYEDELNREA